MNSIEITLSRTEASLVLSILRDFSANSASAAAVFPQVEAVIDTLQAAYSASEAGLPDDEGDQFRSDAEADGDALASAGWGTDEDYRHEPEDAGLDLYWESQTEVPEYDF